MGNLHRNISLLVPKMYEQVEDWKSWTWRLYSIWPMLVWGNSGGVYKKLSCFVFFITLPDLCIAGISEVHCRKSNKKIIFLWTSFMKMWPLSLLLSPQEWHHVGCRWRLRPGRHDGRGPPCGGTAPPAYGQPVEQSAVLNLKPAHLQVFSTLSNRNTHTCNSYWTATTGRNFLSSSVTLADPHHNSPFIFSFSCPQEIFKRTGWVMNNCLLA